MKKVIDELKASSVLTKEEIERIKAYIVKKYPNNSSKENALILSKTIYGIIDNNLGSINGEEKKKIRKNVIRGTILKDKDNILKWDIFKAYIVELEENPKLEISLIDWLNKNQKYTISQDTFEEYVASINNTMDAYKLNPLDNKLPSKARIVKKNVLFSYKRNVRTIILKYKKEFTVKLNNFFEKINIKLEIVSNGLSSRKMALSLLTLLMVSLYSLTNIITGSNVLENKLINQTEKTKIQSIDISDLYVKDAMSYHPHLPDYFNYKSINKDKLLDFLHARNSMLAEEPYFSAIIRASKEFNLNPYLLFAITGQEQSFVPKDHENAEKIANNPFNVFHSWQDYNTDIYDSSRIVARTVINLSKDKPSNIDIFDWINNKYAGDKNWGKGVREIFESFGE